MSEVCFAPGPWAVNDHARDEGVLYIESERCGVASVFIDTPEHCETERVNARLIAFSPDLYAALLSLRNEVVALTGIEEAAIRALAGNANVNCLKRRIEQADAVLAKVKGESA